VLGSGGITLNGGTLQTITDGFVSARAITLNNNVLENLLESSAGANSTATYNGIISGPGGLATGGGGIVVLTGLNTYMGGTHIGSGLLSVSNDANLGAPGGGITLDTGTLLTTADGFSSARPILLIADEGQDTLAAVNNSSATL
jgi:fibronectin-binding autotransporter adhesin